MIRVALTLLLAALCIVYRPPIAWQTGLQYTHKAKKGKKPAWYVHPAKSLERYETSCADLARDADVLKKAKAGFKELQHASKSIAKSTLVGTLDQNRAKNRHPHLLPYDDTLSCRDIQSFYINANDVYTPVQNYLVTQGPLDTTVADFWKAVLHKDSQLIVTLVMAEEEGHPKCASYWSTPEVTVDGWTIRLQEGIEVAKSTLIPSHRLILRTFLAKKGQSFRTVKQLHYENWPDGKVPDFDLFIKLLDEADQLAGGATSPITVHCSAGIGRSGTFVAAHSLRKEVRIACNGHHVHVNVPKAIYLLRCQRLGLVGSARQYQIVLKTIAKEHKPRRLAFFLA